MDAARALVPRAMIAPRTTVVAPNPYAMSPSPWLSLACCAALLPAHAAEDKALLAELLENRQVALSVKGTGKHQGDCVRVTVQNRTERTLHTSIPVGWVFVSNTPEVQDLLVVREEVLALSGGASRTVLCRAFCCEAAGRGPREGEGYRAGHQSTPKLTSVAEAVAHGEYPDEEVQHAVWVLSDGHSIASMGALDSTATDSLRLAVSRLSGQPVPLYSLRFADEPGRVCSGRPEAISRELIYDVPASTAFNAVVVDHRGRIIQVLHDRTLLERGRHRLSFDLVVLGWSTGTYAIHAWSSDRAGVHRMPFTL